MNTSQPIRIKTISAFHQWLGLPRPEHPLISVIRFEAIGPWSAEQAVSQVFDFYAIALKQDFKGHIWYGQQAYDFDAGMMSCMAPGQVLRIERDADEPVNHSGWLLLIHPDLLWHTPLAKIIRQYAYFNYSVHEALFLSQKEEATLTGLLGPIEQEYRGNTDGFSQPLIVAQLEVLYADRFYQRQFRTRKIIHHQLLARLEELLNDYFASEDLVTKGLPTVGLMADSLAVSPGYLSALLKALTGLTTQQYIHQKLIDKAKEQ